MRIELYGCYRGMLLGCKSKVIKLHTIMHVRSAFSLVASCVIKAHTHGWRHLMAWSNLANLFRGSLHDFCQLYYNIKQIDFIFIVPLYCNRSHMTPWRVRKKVMALDYVSCVLFCSSHAMTSYVSITVQTHQKLNLFVKYKTFPRFVKLFRHFLHRIQKISEIT